jgi:glycerophosphoryl diester phosphodiesterase
VSHVAHRGGIDEGDENSLCSFRAAASTGDVSVLELDVRLTLDRKIVVSHDDTFHRLLGNNVSIAQTKYDDLPRLPRSGERVCLLKDLLDDPVCASMPISLDFKVFTDEMAGEVYNMFLGRGRLNLLCWGSFSEATRARLEQLYPDVLRFASLGETIKLYISFLFGVCFLVKMSSSMVCTVLIREEWISAFRNLEFKFPGFVSLVCFSFCSQAPISVSWVVRFLLLLGPSFFTNLVENPLFVMHLKLRGLKVTMWTINSAEEAKRARRAGVCGIITDFPSKKLHLVK